MDAAQILRDGNPSDALAALQARVRKDPADAKLRVFLFQLLAVLGQWDRALNQLNVAGELDAGNLAMVQTYREALRCEVFRSEVFAGKRTPLVFGEPAQWVALVMEAFTLAAAGEYGPSEEAREQAFDEAQATSGRLVTAAAPTAEDAEAPDTDDDDGGNVAEGIPFAWIADADPRLGPILEAIINGRYYWVPFQNISVIHIEAPEDLRDMVWMPAHFTWANGGETVGLIPTRYCGSEASADPRIQLARMTDWEDRGSGVYTGLGQRLLATDVDEYPLMDVREIHLDTAVVSGDDQNGDDQNGDDQNDSPDQGNAEPGVD